eukprot:5689936-Prymnesium_polylepis.1
MGKEVLFPSANSDICELALLAICGKLSEHGGRLACQDHAPRARAQGVVATLALEGHSLATGVWRRRVSAHHAADCGRPFAERTSSFRVNLRSFCQFKELAIPS